MMKKLLLTMIIGASCLSMSKAQTACTPNGSFTSIGVDPITFPDACINTAYSQTFTFNVPNDTCVDLGNPAGCTALVLTNAHIGITGLPSGLTLECPTADCNYTPSGSTGTTQGCFIITGTPDAANVYTPTITATLTAGGLTFPLPYVASATVNPVGVGGCTSTSTDDALSGSSLSVSPNPTSGVVNFNQTVASGVIYDIMGNVVATVENANSVDLSDLPTGIYILSTDSGTIRITKN